MSETNRSTVAPRYRLDVKLGEGGFGQIHLAWDNVRQRKLAMKLERKKGKSSFLSSSSSDNFASVSRANKGANITQLEHEYNIYKRLGKIDCIPKVYVLDRKSDSRYIFMTMDLLGKNLEELLELCGRRFRSKTIYQLGFNLLHTLEDIHKKGVIHKDIKPENVMISTQYKNKLLFVDFGLASIYKESVNTSDDNSDEDNNNKVDIEPKHIPWNQRNDPSLEGTIRYASVNAHFGLVQSRRDDLESFIYMMVYLSKGSLPWQGLTGKDRHLLIGKIKAETGVEELCDGMHPNWTTCFHYIRDLRFDQDPDYNYLRELLSEAANEKGYTLYKTTTDAKSLTRSDDNVILYDWEPLLPKAVTKNQSSSKLPAQQETKETKQKQKQKSSIENDQDAWSKKTIVVNMKPKKSVANLDLMMDDKHKHNPW